jgi:hypothetical protein
VRLGIKRKKIFSKSKRGVNDMKVYLVYLEHEYSAFYIHPVAIFKNEDKTKEEISKLIKWTGNNYIYKEYEVN